MKLPSLLDIENPPRFYPAGTILITAGQPGDTMFVVMTGEVEIPLFGPTRGQLQADYVRNLSYDPANILTNALTQPVTNIDLSPNGNPGAYRSGPAPKISEVECIRLDLQHA